MGAFRLGNRWVAFVWFGMRFFCAWGLEASGFRDVDLFPLYVGRTQSSRLRYCDCGCSQNDESPKRKLNFFLPLLMRGRAVMHPWLFYQDIKESYCLTYPALSFQESFTFRVTISSAWLCWKVRVTMSGAWCSSEFS